MTPYTRSNNTLMRRSRSNSHPVTASLNQRIDCARGSGMSYTQLLLLGSLMIVGAWRPTPARAHLHAMDASKAEAEQRAAELKCKGVFAMGSQWMPCANERELHKALQRES